LISTLRSALVLFAVLFLTVGVSRESTAAPITFNFTGSVTQVPIDDPGTGLAFGDPITGSFTFESTSVDLIAAANSGSYQTSGPPNGISVLIGAFPFATSDFLAVNISSNLPQDQYGVLGCSVDSSCTGDLQIQLFLEDLQGTVFASDGLPLLPPPIGSFEARDFHLIATIAGNQLQVDGTIDTLTCPTCVAVPEPATWLLLAPAFGALRLRRRRG
jgi:hypothetical protein